MTILSLWRDFSYRALAAARLQQIRNLEAALLAANQARAIAEHRVAQFEAGHMVPGEYGDILLTGWIERPLPTERLPARFPPARE